MSRAARPDHRPNRPAKLVTSHWRNSSLAHGETHRFDLSKLVAREDNDPRRRSGFSNHVRKLRLKRGLSQEKLAELADLHRNYVGGVDRGERNFALLNIVALARALHVRPARLLEPLS